MKVMLAVMLSGMVLVLFAHPSNEGAYGTFRSISAENGGAGHFHLGLYSLGFNGERDVSITGEPSGEARYIGGDFYLNLGYAFTDHLSLNIGSSYHSDRLEYKNTGYKRASMGFGDTRFGLKLGFGSDKIIFGAYPFISLPTGDNRVTRLTKHKYPIFGEAQSNPGGVFRYFSSDALDVGVVGLFTIKARAVSIDFNLGYVDRNKNDGTIGLRNNYSIYNATITWNRKGITPFIEFSGIDYIGKNQLFTFTDDDVFGPNPVYFTPGLILLPGKFNINLAVDIRAWEGENKRPFPTALTDSTNITTGWGATPAFAGILGISYCTDFKPEKPKPGQIAGTVLDASTERPVGADIVLYADGSMISSQRSNLDGTFTFSKLESGSYNLKVNAPDYEPASTDVFVKAGETTPVRFSLIRKEGTLVLKVVDVETKQVLKSTVAIGNMPPETVDGEIEKILKTGKYQISVRAVDPQYLPYDREITIVSGKKLELEVALVKKEFKIVLPQVYFETAKSEIKPESYSILDEAAGTIKKVFEGSATIKIEVRGHTDNRGSDAYNMKLSQERANAVKDYFVSKHGIAADRLLTKGYGESKPIASNSNEAGRSRNRRVELVVSE